MKIRAIFSILIGLMLLATIIPSFTKIAKADSTLTLRPNANGDVVSWYKDGGGVGQNWESVDDVTPDYLTSEVTQYTSNGSFNELYNLQDTSESGVISSIEIFACMYGNWPEPCPDTMKLGIKLDTDTDLSDEKLDEFIDGSWVNISYQWVENPWTSSAWQWSEIDDLQIGPVYANGGDESWYRLTQIYLEVNYAGGGGPTGGPTQWINVTLTPGATANISVDPGTWDGEGASIGTNASTATDAFALNNTGTVQCDVTINATNTSAWTLSTSPAHNQFQLQYGTGGGGSPETLVLRPNGNGLQNQWTKVGDDANWKCVDDITPDYFTTYVTPPGNGVYRELYNIVDHSSETGTINNVTVTVCVYNEPTNTNPYYILINDGVNEKQSLISTQIGWNNYTYSFSTNPSDGAWSWSDVDNLQIGIKTAGGDYENFLTLATQEYATVNYGGGGGTTWTNIGLSPASFVTNFTYDASQPFGLKVFMPTSTSSNAAQVSTITFSATAD